MTQQRGKAAQRVELPVYLTPVEVEELLAAAPNGRARLLMRLMWRAGLRVSEALAVTPADLQEEEGGRATLRVRRGKGNKQRLVPAHKELVDAVRAVTDYTTLPATRPLVQATRGTAWQWVQDAWGEAQRRGHLRGHPRIGAHTLRHSAARHWLAHGTPINVVSRWLGHSNLSTTLRYLALVPDPESRMDSIP